MRHSVRSRRSQRGNAMLEFALGWGLLGALFGAGFQYGYSFWIYNSLMNGCNAAAQYGSRISYDTGDPSTYTTALQNIVVYGDPSGGTDPVIPGISTSNVSVTVNTLNSIPTDVTVSIVNFQVNAIFQRYSFNGKPRVTTLYFGQVVCASC